ncbi:MAG: amino acid adenylation domain-containing protein, partial [bacterium]|nr:amino acid adenylation domain-containing protein [bacterium]
SDSIVLAWEFHHAIMDGWSVNSFLVELHNTYFALSSDPAFVPGKLKCSYKDFIIEHLIEKKKKENIRYWQKELEDYQKLDFPKVPGNSSAGQFKHFVIHLGGEPVEKLKPTARKYNSNLKHLCFAAYVYMLNMLSYKNDLVVGLTSHNRPSVEDGDKLIGCFLNTIPVRIKIPPSITWADYIRLIEKKIIEIKNHDGLPFAEITNAVGEKTGEGNPITDNLFNFVDFHIREHITRENSPQVDERDQPWERYGFSNTFFDFTVNNTMGELTLMLSHFTAVIPEKQVRKCVGYFETVLAMFAQEPDSAVGKDKIIPAGEKQNLLYHWNDSATQYPGDKTIHELFMEQTQKNPDSIAVEGLYAGKATSVSYRELERKSRWTAQLLIQKGVKPDAIVGIMTNRSIEMIIGIIAILRAGGAYLPIDSNYPLRRIEFMLKDCELKILLCNTGDLQEPLRETLDIIDLNDTASRGTDHIASTTATSPALPPKDTLGAQAGPENLAYVIYTSGTTGTPKGTLTCHYNVSRVVLATNYIEINKYDRILQLSNYAFDGSVFDIFGALLNGAALVTVNEASVLAMEKLSEIIIKKAITVFFVTTALFNTLVDISIDCLAGIRKILFGGENISVRHSRTALDYLKKNKIIHVYGPTETTVYATYFPINSVPENASTIPIGRPISNTTLYILDSNLNPVPLMIGGEVYIGGDGVARGYLNHPELTAERFVHCPGISEAISTPLHGTDSEQRLYKTGDLARYLPNGNIEFLGRIDLQVKIRGFRIELGEIENQLLKLDEIKENIVITKTNSTSEKYICAYIVPTQTGHFENVATINEELRKKLSLTLPDYMLPSYFVPLEKIPLTPNGKVNRKALPEPEFSETAKGKSYVAPGDKIEEKVAEIWSDILGLEKTAISINANFFQMGGHSLKATIMISKIHREFDSKMPLTEIFKSPTIRGIAQYIKETGKEKYASINPVEKKEYYPASSPQKRLYILQQMKVDNTGYNMPGTALLQEKVGKRKMETTFRKLIARHESLRTSFHIINNQPVQKIHDNTDFQIDYYKTTETDAETVMNQFTRPFDLSKAPLLRVGLVEMEPSLQQALLLDMHHIITDGASQEVLKKEFTALYAGALLPPIRLQYKDYSEWLYRQEQQLSVKQQESYWVNRFSDELSVLDIPTDFPRPIIQSFEGASVLFALTRTESHTLKQLARESGATLYMVILALYTILLSKLSGREDIVVGTPIAARRHADLQNIIGMFVNTLPMRNRPGGNKTFDEFLTELKACVLDAFENQDYQFEDLVEHLSLPGDIGRNPIFDVMFNLNNQSEDTGGVSGPGQGDVGKPPYEHRKGTTKFDLTLTAADTGKNISCGINYCTELFKANTIERFIGYLKKIISGIMPNQNIRIADIEIISEEEKRSLLVDFNDTSAQYPDDTTIHRLFEEQVEKTPNRVALICTNRAAGNSEENPLSLTYRELEQKSNRQAQLLIQKGSKPGDIIAIMADRSIEMITGIMAVLKTGGAYLPIDPGFPVERIKFILKDSSVKLLINNDSRSRFLKPICETLHVVPLNRLEDFHTAAPAVPGVNHHPPHDTSREALSKYVPPTNLANVIYTSGSTGKPKGVMVEHSSIINLALSQINRFGVDKNDRVLQFASICFDASVEQIFITFFSGAALVLIQRSTILDVDHFEAFVTKQSVTHIHATPSFLMNMRIKDTSCLKRVLSGGDVCPPSLANKWKSRTAFFNKYGPTETTVTSIETAAEIDGHLTSISIGKPIDNTCVYILDEYKKPVPRGVAGELYIGGDGVARGYLNRPQLTAERFVQWPAIDVENPHSLHHTLSPKRIYRTGDLVRQLPDGNIRFLGRIDFQVKIRGFRIELGEIENQLRK